MKLSTRARYGTRALVEVARVYPDGTISAKDVAERQGLSLKYLEQIMMALKSAGLVKAVRGVYGGYALSRAPETVSLGDIFKALEGPVAPVRCVDNPEACDRNALCPTRQTWVELRDAIDEVLVRTTLQDLLNRRAQKIEAAGPMFSI